MIPQDTPGHSMEDIYFFLGEYQIYFIECVENIRIFMMFSTHEMKYIWYFVKKVDLNFLFILYFFRRFTVNRFVNHASSRITIK